MTVTAAQLYDPPRDVGCFGYYGFGSGWMRGAHAMLVQTAEACDVCPLKEQCWRRHRRRALALFPAMQQLAEDIMKNRPGIRGAEFVRVYHKETGSTPPAVFMMLGNLEDGERHGRGFHPQHRGMATLQIPLPRLEPVPLEEEP